MSHKEKMQQYLLDANIQMSVNDFVSVTSNIYHGYEAENYDARHFSIEYSKKYWSKVTDYMNGYFTEKSNLSVLDFGCGTGFATDQIIHAALNDKVSHVSCYDLSEAMVAICKSKFIGDQRMSYFANAEGKQALLAKGQQYDIIVCNALLHHILEPEGIFAMISELLQPGGVFIMGHEPNKNFYANGMLQSASKLFRIYKRINKRLFAVKPKHPTKDIALLTRNELNNQGIVTADFPAKIIPKFVDIHVPLSNYATQPWGEIGFDLKYVNRYLNDNFELVSQITYSHIKDQEAYRSILWRNMAELLAFCYPKDGADAIFIFKKIGEIPA